MLPHILCAALALPSLTASADEALPKQLAPAEQAAALRSAETTGLTIYRHDQAASVATDAAIKQRNLTKDGRVRGWITQERGDSIIVTFIDQTPAALYRVPVSKDGVAGEVTALESPAPLTPYEAGASTARAAAVASNFQRCAPTYNSVVLPATNSASDWAVYLLPGTTQSDVVPIGGTQRIEVRGAEVISQRGFTKSCITLKTPVGAVAMTITHLLDNTPTEAHVFWSLWTKKPMYVVTPADGSVWEVQGDKIKLLQMKAGKG